MKTIGVLALQGAFKEHIHHIVSLGHKGIEVRTADQLNAVDALILPGGESTVMGKLINDFSLKEPLQSRIHSGMPVWGTCAGMILLADTIEGTEVSHLGTMGMTVRRNAYGRQLDSFITNEPIASVSDNPVPLVFIRAPFIVSTSKDVETLHKVNGDVVAARQGNMLATSFHPELTEDTSFLRYFIGMID
ncbi:MULTISPECIES: pyridoxal 5'-phosphate synthase glutaminase subunit PdxT [unclassified Fusibacter]|uniref:pyridoxal 5'-phosphate synthase glutaminase subunit PdxT n=1 Tax=unclassified Fusibacter TaxID=2624464 RepID=UPI0010114E66|nr:MULTISPECIES: pyridoxal 5'-phosphate synthase glutaminase subunit PdxT [unclassified Fusibacter]MCK8059143.1 pyridoxal 5'-phosphate synthase glutaminase subunit PdxT [Fusibacter sp. A2]NPE22552.1 pyridoxal 5'-phosphate synthase glutaminase subunit PdxT [Fusibacter sp. A1]RXV60654.1 pyridoxal 5'-phosphate synthase glutaminase subunit PdxT [Fusibacter sp. A1]